MIPFASAARGLRGLRVQAAHLGMTAGELSARQGDLILQFMLHDRVSFGGLIAIGVIYSGS